MGSFSEADLKSKGLTEIEPGKWKKVINPGTVILRTCTTINFGASCVNKKVGNDSIFIPYNVATSKNKKRLFVRKIGTKTIPGMRESIPATNYRKLTKSAWIAYKGLFLKMIEGKQKPYKIEFVFARATKSEHWDFHNLVQLPCDLMTENGWIEDDNVANMIPVWAPHFQDKNNPGVYIRVL